jgi:hypothetical protein
MCTTWGNKIHLTSTISRLESFVIYILPAVYLVFDKHIKYFFDSYSISFLCMKPPKKVVISQKNTTWKIVYAPLIWFNMFDYY